MKVSSAIAARVTAAITLAVLAAPAGALHGAAAAPPLTAAAARDAVSPGSSNSGSGGTSNPHITVTDAPRRSHGKTKRGKAKTTTRGKARATTQPADIAGFARIASGGFGDPENGYAWTMAWFDGKLYVGTSRNNLCNASITQKSAWTRQVTGCPDQQDYLNLDMRAEIWTYTPGTNTWQLVYRSPMVNDVINGHVTRLARDAGYRSMAVYTDRNGVTALYVGTSGFGDYAYLLRTVDGVHFQTLGPAGLGVYAESIRALTPYAGRLFVAPIGGSGQRYYTSAGRDKVFMSDDPASGKWTAASYTGFGDQANGALYTMSVFNGQLYAGISNNSGFQVWRTNAQGRAPYQWTAVVVDGGYRGSPSPTITAMAAFNNKLYIGTAAETIGPEGKAAQPSEIIAVNPDDSWDLVVGDARQTPEGFKAPLSGMSAGFNNKYNVYLWNLAAHDGWLYAGTYNWSVFTLAQSSTAARTVGFDLWKTRDGTHWTEVSTTGFDNPYNYGVRTMVDTPLGLFLGTANPFANAPEHQGGAEIWLLPIPGGAAHPHDVSLAGSTCPMAHCAPNLDNNQNVSIPTNGARQAWQFKQQNVAFALALGCATGVHIIACAGTKTQLNFQYDAGYVYALDFQGHLLWDSRRLLNALAAGGVPLIDNQDNVYVSDNNSIISFDAQGVVRWQVPNPAKQVLVSMNMLPSGYLVGQAGLSLGHGLILTINPQTGAIVSSLDLADTVNGISGEWGTANTVSVVGNRLYTVTQFVPASQSAPNSQRFGRLYAIDADADGRLRIAWSFSFQGPSGASPVAIPGPHTTIYFDGTGVTQGVSQTVTLFAVQDQGSAPKQLWARNLTADYGIPYPTNAPAAGIEAAPAHDPRGGIWVWSEFDRRLFHFDETTGQTIESLDLAALTGDPNPQPDGVITIVPNGGSPVLIVGVLASAGHRNSVVAIDLTSKRLLWSMAVGSGVNAAPFGQFPIAQGPNGPLLIAPTSDGIVHAYSLN